jgi:transposase
MNDPQRDNLAELTSQERCRLEVLQAVLDDVFDVGTAAALLGRSERQVYRLLEKLKRSGPPAVVHGNKGRSPANRTSDAVWDLVVRLSVVRYRDLNDRELKLALERDLGIRVGRESLRRHIRAAGVPPKRQRTVRRAEPREHESSPDRAIEQGRSHAAAMPYWRKGSDH